MNNENKTRTGRKKANTLYRWFGLACLQKYTQLCVCVYIDLHDPIGFLIMINPCKQALVSVRDFSLHSNRSWLKKNRPASDWLRWNICTRSADWDYLCIKKQKEFEYTFFSYRCCSLGKKKVFREFVTFFHWISDKTQVDTDWLEKV